MVYPKDSLSFFYKETDLYRSKHLFRFNLALIALGALAAGWWFTHPGLAQLLSRIAEIRWMYLLPLPLVTAYCIFFRFLRFQFLLRRAGVRIPIRRSFSVYIASLVGLATPGYIGELVRAVMIRQQFGVPAITIAMVFFIERFLDLSALGTMMMIAASDTTTRLLAVLIACAGAIGAVVTPSIGVIFSVPGASAVATRPAADRASAFAISLLAWFPVAFLFPLAAAGLGYHVPLAVGMGVLGRSTILGALGLMPAGVGVAGSVAIDALGQGGISTLDAIAIVTVVRLSTVGFSIITAAIFFVWKLKFLSNSAGVATASEHFDEIAGGYSDQFSSHIWDHLLQRKLQLIADSIPSPPATAGVGVDLGCGLGRQCIALRGRNYNVIGIDPAINLLQSARKAGAIVAVGDALRLPFADNSLDFVYTIGVLHHLPGKEAQAAACREVARVLKPGGRFMIHETNPRNPLFRFYMGYAFPILKTIDDGTEYWLETERWNHVPGLQLVKLAHFTFLPDFVPRMFMGPFRALERSLENSQRSRPYSVHYMATLEKRSDG